MAETRPRGEQLRFVSSKTGPHILDDYLEACEHGIRELPDMIADLFDAAGVFRSDLFEFREDPSNAGTFQYRVGQFVNASTGWITMSTTDFTQFVSDCEAAQLAAETARDLSSDWAIKPLTTVDGTNYSAKYWAEAAEAEKDTAEEWATKTSSPVANGEYSAKYWATHPKVITVADNIGDIGTVADDIQKVIDVADDLNEAISEIETAADDLNETTSEIDTVATNITNVNTVGTNINAILNVDNKMSIVTNVDTNMSAVINCDTNMSAITGAPARADDAEKYAVHPVNTQFTDSDGSTSYSAKHYATLASSSGKAYITIEGDVRSAGDTSGLLATTSQSALIMLGKGGAQVKTEQGTDTVFFDSRAVAMALALG
jgi:hypothetical protein